MDPESKLCEENIEKKTFQFGLHKNLVTAHAFQNGIKLCEYFFYFSNLFHVKDVPTHSFPFKKLFPRINFI